MFNISFPALTSVLLLTLSLGSCAKDSQQRAAQSQKTTAQDTQKSGGPKKVSPKATPTTRLRPLAIAGSVSRNIKLAALKALPAPTFIAVPGYPGKGFHIGAFQKAASWKAFQDIAKLELGAVDFDKQIVVYTVLDAQTNDLNFKSIKKDTEQRATWIVEWSGIEPFYPDDTPGVFAIIDRDLLQEIEVKTESEGVLKPLGLIKL